MLPLFCPASTLVIYVLLMLLKVLLHGIKLKLRRLSFE